MIPLRFRILTSAIAKYATHGGAVRDDWPEGRAGHLGFLNGEAINLSAGGIGFKSREKLAIGDQLDIYLTVPPSFTGRSFEQVRCKVHIVHVDPQVDVRGLIGFGAVVDKFEAVAVAQFSFS